ncbi:polysaccharide deacetylase family protein [Sphaerisporangium sp. NPDC049002]|uniref:polysaccharide deacetylase family protein n=1 Tax=unclassified Sphaerisporangium TaxID=2630420 RepID=UPI0033F02DA0
MSRLLRSGGIAVLIAVTAGCGVTLPFSFEDEPTTLPAQPTTINFVAPSEIGELPVRTVSDDSADHHVFVSYPTPASAPELAERLRQTTSAAIRRFSQDRRARPKGGTPPELNVGWQLTAASGGVFGVRMRTGLFTGTEWRNSLSTLWYDQAARRVHDSADLLKDAKALSTLAEIVQNRVWALGQGTKVDAVKPDRAMFDSLNFNPHGDLVAEFDDGQVAPARMGRIAVAVPKQEAAPLLSDFGRRTMEVVDSATPDSIPNSPPPESTPVPGTTGAGHSVDCAATRCVALTFDDGPGPQTDRLLSILAEYGARATFFTVGANAEAQPALLRRIADGGHLIGNHSWSHRDLATLDMRKISDELGRTQMMLSATGPAPALLRAPYGGLTPQVVTVARALRLSIVGWTLDTGDARDPDPAAVARRAIDGARPGSVILMHEGGSATLRALPKTLKALASRGYAFVTVPELYGSRGMEPGQVYAAAPPH